MKRMKLFLATLVLSLSSVLGVVAPQVHAATTFTWDGGGGDNNMTTDANWAGDTAPSGDADEDLVFPANVTKLTVTNDFPATTEFNSIVFSGTVTQDSNYTISGSNSMTIAGGISNDMTGSGGALFQTISVPLILSADQTFTSASAQLKINGTINLSSHRLTVDYSGGYPGSIWLAGVISGTGGITKTGTGSLFLEAANTYSGTTVVSGGILDAGTETSLGTTAGGTSVAAGARLFLRSEAGQAATYAEPLTLAGNGTAYSLGVGTSPICSNDKPYPTTTLTGAITLTADILVFACQQNGKITGVVSGAHTIGLDEDSSGTFELASSSNGSSTANGTLALPVKTTEYSDDLPATSITVHANETAVVTGTYGGVTVNAGGTLKGNGTVGQVVVWTDGTIAPGLSPGCLNTGNLNINGGTYQAEIGGTTVCTGYDQVTVTGTVDISSDSILSVSRYNKFVPKTGQKYVIVSNDGSDAVTGTFKDLAEGAKFDADGVTWSISYKGGDGNDIELTVTAVSPDTGFMVLTNNPYVTMAVMLGAAGAIALLARRQFRPAFTVRRKR